MKYLIVCLISVTSFSCFGAGDKLPKKNTPKVIHWGINLEPLEYFEIAALRFKKNVEIRTNKNVLVNLSIGKYKQDERDHLKDVQSGVYNMGQEVVNNLIKHEPSFKVWELPFLFESDKHVFDYTKTKFAQASLRNLDSKGIYGLEYTYSGGFMHLVGPKVNDAKDLKDKILYTEAASEEYLQRIEQIFKLKGTEDYDQGVIGHSNRPFELISSVLEELYEAPKSQLLALNTTRHRVFVRVLFISQSFLKTLPKKHRDIVIEEGIKAARFERELSLEASNFHLENIKNHYKYSIVINEWPLEKRNKMRKYFWKEYEAFDKKFGKNTTKEILNLVPVKSRKLSSN